MTSFDHTKTVGERGVDIVVAFLRERSLNAQVVTTDKGRHAVELQKTLGDVLFNSKNGGNLVSVEVKTELENRWGNLFLERYSNRSRNTDGWFITLKCDWLFYLFLDQMRLLALEWDALHQWAGNGRLEEFELKHQKKYDQLNDTWGFCVPIQTLRDEVHLSEWELSDGVWSPISKVRAVA